MKQVIIENLEHAASGAWGAAVISDAIDYIQQLDGELEKLRELLAAIRVSINLDDTEYGFTKEEKRVLVDKINAALAASTGQEV